MKQEQLFGFSGKLNTFWLHLEPFPKLAFSVHAEIDGVELEPFAWKQTRADETATLFEASNRHGKWKYTVTHGNRDAAGSLTLELECELKRKANRVCLTSIRFQDFSANHVLGHGRAMGGCSSYVLQPRKSHSLQSAFFTSVTTGAGTLQLSHPLMQDEFSEFTGTIKGKRLHRLASSTTVEPCPRRVVKASPVTLAASADGHSLMVNWADEQSPKESRKELSQESGWNSWDYYRWTITEEEVLKNAEFIASDEVLSKHVKRIIVDDGWQYCYGEWDANSLFPSGMHKLAQRLNRMGFTAGLWIAPTIAEPHSRIAQTEPDMLAMGRSGVPCLAYECMERYGFVLDPTSDKVKKFWETLFQRYARYGYRYFKLDFLAATLKAYRFADPNVPKGRLMRQIVEPIRNAVGSECRLLGCNYNFEGGTGVVDDVRIGSDIHANWGAVKRNALSVAARFWAHRRLWVNDPDFSVCRGGETSDDPQLHQVKPLMVFVKPEDANADPRFYMDSLVSLSATEAEVLLSLVITSGGAINLSDNLPRLNAAGLSLLRKTVSAEKGEAAVPLDLFRSSLPSCWVQRLPSHAHRVLLINWTSKEAEHSVDLRALNLAGRCAMDFWKDQPIRIAHGKITARLAPHSCLLAELH